MMSKSYLLGCLGLCLVALSLSVSASVTDPNIISGVVRINPDADSSDTEPNFVPGGLHTGAAPYVDRTFGFGLVDGLTGLDYIQTVVDDKDNPNHQLNVTVNKAGILYLMIDNRVGDDNATNPPTLGSGIMDWVGTMGFTQTQYTVNISTSATVYALPVAAPGTISLGAQNNGTSRVMYVVAAAPSGWNLEPFTQGIAASVSLVLPNSSLTIDGTLLDDGVPGTGLTIVWTTVTQPAGTTVEYAPDNTTEDITITFSDNGSYTIKATVSDGEKTIERTLQVTVTYPISAMHAPDGNNDIEIGNDGTVGPASRMSISGSGLGARNIATRRRVSYVRFNLANLGTLGTNEVFANSFMSIRSVDNIGGKLEVYGVREHLDNFTMSSVNWNTGPGVPNTPVPPLDSPVTLDTADLTVKLLEMTFAAKNTRYSSVSSSALADFLNSDTDGSVTFLLAGTTVGDDVIVRSRNYTSAGTGYTPPGGSTEYHGVVIGTEKRVPTWASKPNPANYSIASSSLAQLSWTNPPEPVGTVTCDVYFGTDPNALVAHYGLPKIGNGISGNSIAVPYPLTFNEDYYWIVDIHDSGRVPELTTGTLWTFVTNNAPPTVIAGSNQYIWRNNVGDPNTATVNLDGSVNDDGLPSGTLTRLWTQRPTDPAVLIDPNGIILATGLPANTDDITLKLPATGTYQFTLTGNDGSVSSSATVQVYVGATPCAAAQAKPNYTALAGDIDDDCNVDIADLGMLASHWLECNSLAPCY